MVELIDLVHATSGAQPYDRALILKAFHEAFGLLSPDISDLVFTCEIFATGSVATEESDRRFRARVLEIAEKASRSYRASWKAQRRKSLVTVVLFLLLFVLLVVDRSWATFLVFMLACFVFGNVYALHPCPRCQEPFAFVRGHTRILWNPWPARCANCRLRKGYVPALARPP